MTGFPATRRVTRDLTRPVLRPHAAGGSGGGDGGGSSVLSALSFVGAADWWAGAKDGTHQEVWAGNASRDTLTMGYAPIMPVAVGVRTWFGGPDAAFHNGCAYVPWAGAVGGDTVMGVSKFTCATGAWEHATVATVVGSFDDHNKLNVHICSDGKILLMIARQVYANDLRWWKSDAAEDISSFTTFSKTLAGMGGDPNYATIGRFSGDGGRIYVLLRAAMYADLGDGGIWYVASTDEFGSDTNVSAPAKLIATAAGAAGGNSGLYFHGSCNGVDRFDLAISHFYDNSPDPKIVHDVIHCYLTASAGTITVHASDGTNLGTGPVAYSAFTKGNGSLIYDTSVDVGNYRIWAADVQCYGGSPAVTACRYNDGDTNTEYDYLRWDFAGTAWSDAKVVWDASADGANGPVGTTSAYNNYYGGCRMDPSDANLMWLSVGDNAGTSRIKKLTSTDLFASARVVTEPYTQARKHNIRPVIPYNLAGDHIGEMDVLWLAGHYNSATSYNTVHAHPYWSGARQAFDFNESVGTPATKLNNAANTPALIGSPTLGATGVSGGKAMQTNGTDQGLNTDDSMGLGAASIGAFIHWQKLGTLAATQVHGATEGGATRKFWGILGTNEWMLGVGSSSVGSSLGGTGITTGAWHHWGVLVGGTGGMPRMTLHLDGVPKLTHADSYGEVGRRMWLGMLNNSGSGANWVGGAICQFVEDIGAGRDAIWLGKVAGYASAGSFTSAKKTAQVMGGPAVGITVTPAATLPMGTSYDLTLYSDSTPAGQTKTGTAATPIDFDAVTITDGDEVWIEIAAASLDKTQAPRFTGFTLAA